MFLLRDGYNAFKYNKIHRRAFVYVLFFLVSIKPALAAINEVTDSDLPKKYIIEDLELNAIGCGYLEKIQFPYNENQLVSLHTAANGKGICAVIAREYLYQYYEAKKVTNVAIRFENQLDASMSNLIRNKDLNASRVACFHPIYVHFSEKLSYQACSTVLAHQNLKENNISYKSMMLANYETIAIAYLMLYYTNHQDDFLGRARLCMEHVMPSKDILIQEEKPICSKDAYILANDYITGEDGIKVDYQKAFLQFQFLNKVVTKPDIKALVLLRLGMFYSKGIAVKRNFKIAIDDFKESMKLDSTNALTYFYLGMCYDDLVDFHEAFPLLLKAAKMGLPKAQAMVALYYYAGYGVIEDVKEAYAWISIGILNGIGDQYLQNKVEGLKAEIIHILFKTDPSGNLFEQARNLEKEYYQKYSANTVAIKTR